MPPKKRKQKSRPNSMQEINLITESLAKSQNENDVHSLKGEEKFPKVEEIYEEMELEDVESKIKVPLSRIHLLIQDYLEFRAARCIQRYVRAWLYQTKYKRQRLAAIKIQSEWRRFYCQRMYFHKYEQFLQLQIEQHFYRAAQKIQAFWRGWWVRHHIHNHCRLMRLQLMAGEDLLYCVAFKLHHLLRTHQIPGVYSLRNSSAFSKVEQLLNSLKFRTYNKRSIQAVEKGRHELENARKQHKKSAYGTKVPFPGPDNNNCYDLKCEPLFTAKDADLRMSKILQMYEQANREISKPKVLKKKKSGAFYKSPPAKTTESQSSFCADVVTSMKKWKIIGENLNVDPNIFKKPQNVENFLRDIESKMSLLQGNCYCKRELFHDFDKAKENFGLNQAFLNIKNDEQKMPITGGGLRNLPPLNLSSAIISSAALTIDEAKSYMKKANLEQQKGATFIKFSEESITSDDVI